MRSLLTRCWRWLRRGHDERKVAEARARFWAEVRAGELEAEAEQRRHAAALGARPA
jgi:hypothetical protein